MHLPPLVQVVPYAAQGGTESHVAAIVRELAPETPVAVVAPPGPAPAAWQAAGAACFTFPSLKLFAVGRAQLLASALRSAYDWAASQPAKTGRPGEHAAPVVHVHGAAELLPFARRTAKSGIVFTAHGFSGKGAGVSYWLTARAIPRWADRALAVSQAEARRLCAAGLPADRIQVIYNGVSDPADPPLTPVERVSWRKELLDRLDGDPVRTAGAMGEGAACPEPSAVCLVGTIARLTPPKGIHHLIEAFARLRHTAPLGAQRPEEGARPRLVLAIVGAGSAEADLRRLARRRNVSDRVVWVGAHPEAARLAGAFDVFVLPSTAEAFGLVCVEAMAHAVPVVATQVGGLPEALGPHPPAPGASGAAGLLVPPGDPDALARAIHRLWEHPGLRRRLGSAGRARFLALFTAPAMAHRLAALYSELASESRGS